MRIPAGFPAGIDKTQKPPPRTLKRLCICSMALSCSWVRCWLSRMERSLAPNCLSTWSSIQFTCSCFGAIPYKFYQAYKVETGGTVWRTRKCGDGLVRFESARNALSIATQLLKGRADYVAVCPSFFEERRSIRAPKYVGLLIF